MPAYLASRLLLTLFLTTVLAAEVDAAAASATAPLSRALMSGEQVVQILDETVDWYRTLGTQQLAARQPSDLLILYANRQTANKVMALAFEIARANAELLSSEAALGQADHSSSSQSLMRIRQDLDAQRSDVQARIKALRARPGTGPKKDRADLETRLSVFQAELDLINARRNLLANRIDYAGQNDASGSSANALKAHIDAIAASIPSQGSSVTEPAATGADQAAPSLTASVRSSLSQFGTWDLVATVFRLSAKGATIDSIDQRTADLQRVFAEIRQRPIQQLEVLAARSDALAADAAGGHSNLKAMRDQYDTLAWLFQQTAAVVTPLSRMEVLLDQYRRNLASWRDATRKQFREALWALATRLGIFAGLLLAVVAAAELWRRGVFRYVRDARRRSRYLLLRKIVLWCLVVLIVASAFVTELGSLATFAGLITAGLAVAMQSVLVSVVGYFFLIGKYGVRVGDRVQVGTVTGEVIDLGLVRMHLMELSGQGTMSPTGRIVAFANSVIFQASGGLFKQLPGVKNLAWHEIAVNIPQGSDYPTIKNELVEAVTRATREYRDDIVRQTREIQKASSLQEAAADPQPQVQLKFSASGVDAVVRYPVQLTHAAEIDERVSRELLNVVSPR